jgi:hypothetical protein
MTEDEYKAGLTVLENNFEMAKKKLMWEYGMSKVIFKVGDIIKDERWAMLIDKITVSRTFGSRLPEPLYQGLELKKDLTPRKDGNRVSIYGNNAQLITK